MHLKILGSAGDPSKNNGFFTPPGTPRFLCPRTNEHVTKWTPHETDPNARRTDCQINWTAPNMFVKSQLARFQKHGADTNTDPIPLMKKYLNLALTKEIVKAYARSRTWVKAHGNAPIQRPDTGSRRADTPSTSTFTPNVEFDQLLDEHCGE
jgi:hypothetical protein